MVINRICIHIFSGLDFDIIVVCRNLWCCVLFVHSFILSFINLISKIIST